METEPETQARQRGHAPFETAGSMSLSAHEERILRPGGAHPGGVSPDFRRLVDDQLVLVAETLRVDLDADKRSKAVSYAQRFFEEAHGVFEHYGDSPSLEVMLRRECVFALDAAYENELDLAVEGDVGASFAERATEEIARLAEPGPDASAQDAALITLDPLRWNFPESTLGEEDGDLVIREAFVRLAATKDFIVGQDEAEGENGGPRGIRRLLDSILVGHSDVEGRRFEWIQAGRASTAEAGATPNGEIGARGPQRL